MAQIQQRVFFIFVRPCYVKRSSQVGYPNTVTKYFGRIYREPTGGEAVSSSLPTGYSVAIEIPKLNAEIPANSSDVVGGGLERYYASTKGHMPSDDSDEGNVSVTSIGKLPINEDYWFSQDAWLLHSTWTSFEKCKDYVKGLVDIVGFDSVLVASAINMELELLPNK